MITYDQYLKTVLKQEALTDYPDVKSAAQKAFDLDKKAIIAATKRKVKASTGAFTPARAAAKAKADLLKKIYAKQEPPTDDEKIYKLAVESKKNILDCLEDVISEEGESSTGSAMNTTQSIGGTFAAKLGEVPNYNGKSYKADISNMFTRYSSYGKKKKKNRKESVEVDNFIDNLFE